MSHINGGRMRRLGVWLCVLVGMGVLCGPAQALVVHKFEKSFGETGTGAGQLKGPEGIAVNDSTSLTTTAGNVYVVDSGNGRVERFSATGEYLGEFNGSGSYEVEGKMESGPAPPTGAFSPSEETSQIAVDDSGSPLDPSNEDVYVVDQYHGVIDKFSPTGAYISQLTGTPVITRPSGETAGGPFESGNSSDRSIEGVAVDPDGTLWVTTYNAPIYSFNEASSNVYASERETVYAGTAGSRGLGVDTEDNLYFNHVGFFVKVTSAGKTVSNPFGGDENPFAIAVDPVAGEVYLANDEKGTGFGEGVEAFGLDGSPIESSQNGAPFPGFGVGSFGFGAGIAVNTSTGTVYVTDRRNNDVVVFEAVSLPSSSVGVPSEQQPRSVTLNGTVNPEGKLVTSCVFEYDTRPYVQGEAAHGTDVPCSPAGPGSGSSPVAVTAHLTGLKPQTTYDYRLVAGNSAGSNPGPNHEFFTGPRLDGEYVTGVASNSGTLHGQVDPNGGDTNYYFEYGTTTGYGVEVPLGAPGVDIGSSDGVQDVSFHLQGLEASTTYHYRLVAVQDGETFAEPDRTFTTQSAGGEELTLPDGRAWELVSPPNKKAVIIGLDSNEWLTQAAGDGSGITYTVNEPLGEGVAGRLFWSQELSSHTAEGWRTQDVSGRAGLPPEGESTAELFGAGELWHVFSSNLSLGLLQPGQEPAPQSSEATERTLYVRNNDTGAFQPLENEADVPSGLKFGDDEMQYFTGTPDLSHVVFGTWLALTPESVSLEPCKGCTGSESEHEDNLYEWYAGKLELVNILPNGTTRPGARAGSALPTVPGGEMTARAISSDGRWVVWHYGQLIPMNGGNKVGLYVRDMVEKQTYKVGGPYARFETMSSDGSKVFYVETEEGLSGDLHVFEPATGKDIDLTADHSVAEQSAGLQNGVLGVSQDGSYVYFVATGVLANGGVSGVPNLYVAHEENGAWSTTHIATLSWEDQHTWGGTNEHGGGPNPVRLPWYTSSEVSPNGRYVAFMSNSPLTGYDNLDARSGQRDEEVFLYDATSNHLVCASCDPTGARPVGVFDQGEENGAEQLLVDQPKTWTELSKGGNTDHWLAGSLVGWNNELNVSSYEPRYVMNDGRLFFNSPDALVPQDTNGLEDVYEYEPASVGSCTEQDTDFSPATGACVSLISSGQSLRESAFMDASESGDDVFFVTAAKLVAEDYDNAYDMYDAHVCSSAWPCRTEPVSPPECTSGDSCKAAPSPQPEIFGPTPSATFNGQGNIVASSSVLGVKPRSLTRTQKLANALHACRKDKTKRKRTVCERQAKKRYGTAKQSRVSQSRVASAIKKGNG